MNERAWIAEKHGIFWQRYLMKETRKQQGCGCSIGTASPWVGLGKKLVSECTAFAREADTRHRAVDASTLTAARKLYVNEGYKLKQEPHHSFGKDLVGETWQLVLTK